MRVFGVRKCIESCTNENKLEIDTASFCLWSWAGPIVGNFEEAAAKPELPVQVRTVRKTPMSSCVYVSETDPSTFLESDSESILLLLLPTTFHWHLEARASLNTIMVFTQSLPPELWEIIIELSEGSRGTLSSCARVCRSWVPKSRVLLFRVVHFDSSTQRARAFMDALLCSPSLGELIHELIIDPQFAPGCRYWIYDLIQMLAPILPNLYHMGYHRLFSNFDPWFYFLCQRFETVKSLSLCSLEYNEHAEVVQLVNMYKTLETLSLFNCERANPGRFTGRTHPGLTTLRIRSQESAVRAYPDLYNCTNMYDWITCTPNPFPAVKALTLPLHFATHINTFNDLLKTSTHDLEELELEIFIAETHDIPRCAPAFRHCKHLRSLTLDLWDTPPQHIAPFLEAIAMGIPETLQNISFRFSGRCIATWIFSEETKQHWRAIDAAAADSPELELFEVKWAIVGAGSAPLSDSRDVVDSTMVSLDNCGVFEEYFPRSFGRGILWCGDRTSSSKHVIRERFT
ncbi:hypothetical protein NLI96_g8725 [Meripilus lineatus]|uniref:F-box domain-containing protein n=1 Tax=Meripilus lineatus TaxID=2056292 RepID=A0AAD5UWV8_9APHY|nr:hypothetical protein NLI96_g8725 [Physisporinus lineatus]